MLYLWHLSEPEGFSDGKRNDKPTKILTGTAGPDLKGNDEQNHCGRFLCEVL